jgi:hypothetical protein
MFSLLLIDAVDKKAKRENGEQEVYDPALPSIFSSLILRELTPIDNWQDGSRISWRAK